ncbi:MAG TPA: hypothetical protein DEA26_08075 [Oceanospirillales bacterium]|nr:hypothetical protein [Oceanospirillaceae bacterium]HBS42623.1 hypothetical protein [Oceanospirillales bacterium]|tara:strand:+ start:2228 stop:2716 length:489 start_codon:yes stop_codon:yes gene_type:complete
MLRFISTTAVLLLLTACGWHLRGVTPLPAEYKVMYVEGQQTTNLYVQLVRQLEFNNVLVTSTLEDAPVVMRLEEYEIEKRTLAVDTNGRVSEYEMNGLLLVTVERLLSGEKIELEVTSRRTLTNDINNVVATQAEETNVRNQIDSDLINKLLRRLQSLNNES